MTRITCFKPSINQTLFTMIIHLDYIITMKFIVCQNIETYIGILFGLDFFNLEYVRQDMNLVLTIQTVFIPTKLK